MFYVDVFTVLVNDSALTNYTGTLDGVTGFRSWKTYCNLLLVEGAVLEGDAPTRFEHFLDQIVFHVF